MSTQPFPIQAVEVINLVANMKSQGLLSKEDLATIVKDIMTALPPHMRTKPHSDTRCILDAFLQGILDEAEVRGGQRKNAVPEAVGGDGDREPSVLASIRSTASPEEDSGGKKQSRKAKRTSGRLL